MSEIISKELLNEVLGDSEYGEISWCRMTNVFGKNKNILEYQRKNWLVEKEQINIHELAHKCKEWALLNGYWVESYIALPNTEGICKIGKIGINNEIHDKIENTEPEAIFKACQWILDNKDQKCKE